MYSGVHVAMITASISSELLLAEAKAFFAATVARSVKPTCDILLSFTPVLEVIHSSLVSRKDSKSLLVKATGGMHLPHPVISMPI